MRVICANLYSDLGQTAWPFMEMHGLGNDFCRAGLRAKGLVLDARQKDVPDADLMGRAFSFRGNSLPSRRPRASPVRCGL